MDLDLKNDELMLSVCCNLILEYPFGVSQGGWCYILRTSSSFIALKSIAEGFDIDIEIVKDNVNNEVMLVNPNDVRKVKEFCAKTLDMLRL